MNPFFKDSFKIYQKTNAPPQQGADHATQISICVGPIGEKTFVFWLEKC